MAKRIYLSDIVNKKRERLQNKPFLIEGLIRQIAQIHETPSFYNALAKDGLSIIGEIKKASPSKGLIKADFKPYDLAKQYEGCVDAISVLTEEDFFLGHDAYLKEVSANVTLPTLCKDFIIEPNQIYNAKALGASCVLLIVAILTDRQLIDFLTIAESLGMDALVETHTRSEVKRAVAVGARIIGINNRNLNTFKTDIKTTLRLRKYIPEDKIVISESGIFTAEDVKLLKEARIHGILVGESFMKSGDIHEKAKEFKNAYIS